MILLSARRGGGYYDARHGGCVEEYWIDIRREDPRDNNHNSTRQPSSSNSCQSLQVPVYSAMVGPLAIERITVTGSRRCKTDKINKPSKFPLRRCM